MIVFNKNLLEIPKNEIYKTKVKQTIFQGRVVFDRDEAIIKLDVVDIELTNEILANAVDAAELNLLFEDELGGGHTCFTLDLEVDPGAKSAPDEINKAFASLSSKGYRFLRSARTVFWKADNSTYWIQWTVKDDVKVFGMRNALTGDFIEFTRGRKGSASSANQKQQFAAGAL